MDNEKTTQQDTETQDARPRYEPPRALRMSDMHAGTGDCWPFGSGDALYCSTGNSAGG